MKYFFKSFWVFLTIVGFCTYGQEDNFYQDELYKMVKIPNSPEAEAFSKYGNTPVNLYTGTPEISIPLHTLKGREIDLPLSITYDASGIKVEQMATWLGLGWNLNAGGRITRITNGLPDDYIYGGGYSSINDTTVVSKINAYRNESNIFSSPNAVREYFNFLDAISTNEVDAQPDYYSINVPGINETIVFDINDGLAPKVLNNPRIKVEVSKVNSISYPIDSWTITGEDGTKYYFEKKENTKRQDSDKFPGNPVIYEYTSSWLLTKIESTNLKDVYTFNYMAGGYWSQEQLGSSATRITTEFQTNQFEYPQGYPQHQGIGVGYFIDQQFLSSITYNGHFMVYTNIGNRSDIDTQPRLARLATLAFYDLAGGVLKTIEFDNDHYFNPMGVNPEDIRLKLEGFDVKGQLGNTYQTYSFEYERPDELPSRRSLSQDYLGYYNGANNSVLYTKYQSGSYFFHGADRNPNAYYARTGILKKITYPTKGFTEFEYESHDEYVSTTSGSTINHLNMALNGNYTSDPNLYRNSQGNLCDDKFADYDFPKIKFATFTIPETGSYVVDYEGDTDYSEAYIVYLGPETLEECITLPNGLELCPEETYTNYCEYFSAPNNMYWTHYQYNSLPVEFEAGVYKVMLVLDEFSSGQYAQTSLSITEEVTSTVNENVDVGGIRIKSIKDYSRPGVLESTKLYSYRNEENISTATINYKPILATTKSYGTQSGPRSKLIRTTSFPKGDTPFVTYKSVKEFILDDYGQSEGHTVYDFYTNRKGAYPRISPPYETNYYASLDSGNPKEIIKKNQTGDMVSKQNIEYSEYPENAVSVNGLVAYRDENLLNSRVMIKEIVPSSPPGASPYYIYENVEEHECTGEGSLCPVNPVFTNPGQYGFVDVLSEEVSMLRSRFSFISGTYGGVSKVVDTLYFKDEQDNPIELATAENTIYGSDIKYLPRKKTMVDSKGATHETVFYYPEDAIGVGYDLLLDKNNLTAVMKVETVKESTNILATKEYDYSLVDTDVVLPTLLKNKLKGSNEGVEIEFTYYSNGNLKEARRKNGPVTTYVWGYDDKYLVAKIDNAGHADILSTTTDFGILNNLLSAEEAKRAELETLRTGLPNAQVTTYTYETEVGVSSITDPRGYSFYFEYDEFNRLKATKDADGNYVSDQRYHYIGQTINTLNP